MITTTKETAIQDVDVVDGDVLDEVLEDPIEIQGTQAIKRQPGIQNQNKKKSQNLQKIRVAIQINLQPKTGITPEEAQTAEDQETRIIPGDRQIRTEKGRLIPEKKINPHRRRLKSLLRRLTLKRLSHNFRENLH